MPPPLGHFPINGLRRRLLDLDCSSSGGKTEKTSPLPQWTALNKDRYRIRPQPVLERLHRVSPVLVPGPRARSGRLRSTAGRASSAHLGIRESRYVLPVSIDDIWSAARPRLSLTM